MTTPFRCISSHLTSEVLTFRNPQGGEENWLVNGERIGNLFVFLGKVVTTEIASALLCVAATVETVAYGILLLGSLLVLPLSHRPLAFCYPLLSSSSFTVFWNLGNLLVFNPFCINAITHESFARYTIDNWPRGQAFKAVLRVASVALLILSLITRSGGSVSGQFSETVDGWTRNEDSLYILDWFATHGINREAVAGFGNEQFRHLVDHGHQNPQVIAEGATFIKEHILKKLKENVRKEVLEDYTDADIMLFITAKAILHYASSTEDIPFFFKPTVRAKIVKLRGDFHLFKQHYSGFCTLLLVSFSSNPKVMDGELQPWDRLKLINQLKELAWLELDRGSPFVQRSWPQACQEALADQQSNI